MDIALYQYKVSRAKIMSKLCVAVGLNITLCMSFSFAPCLTKMISICGHPVEWNLLWKFELKKMIILIKFLTKVTSQSGFH